MDLTTRAAAPLRQVSESMSEAIKATRERLALPLRHLTDAELREVQIEVQQLANRICVHQWGRETGCEVPLEGTLAWSFFMDDWTRSSDTVLEVEGD